MESKECSKCGETKPVTEFHRRSEINGYASHCKTCAKAKKAAYYKANRDRIIKRTGAYQRTHLDQSAKYAKRWRNNNPEKVKAHNDAYIAADPEGWRERRRKWAEANPDKEAERRRRWQANNREKTRENTRQRKARKNGHPEFIEVSALALAQEGRCGICGTELREPIELDHTVPLSKGGQHTPANAQLAHRSCNRQKHARDVADCAHIRPLD